MPKAVATRKTYKTPSAHNPAPARVTRSQDADAQEPAAAANNSNRSESDACRLFSPEPDDGTSTTTNQNKKKRKQNHDPAHGGSQDQARRKQEQQPQPETERHQDQEEADEDEVEEGKEDDQHSLQQQNGTNENDNVANETRHDDENPGDEDDYVQEPDGDWLDYVDENYGHLTQAELKEKKRKLSPEAKIYWEHFKELMKRYELRWDIKFTDLYKPGENETDTVVYYQNKTPNAMLYEGWRNCCGLIESRVPVLNEVIGIYIAIICGPDPNITYNVVKLANELKVAFPNNGKSDEEMKSLAENLISKSLDCTELTEDRNSRFTMKVGCILKQKLYKRLRNLIDFNSRPGQIQFKFFATKDLCPERVLILEDLIKFSLWLEKRYSGNGEVYYGNKFVANHLLQQAKIFAENGHFTYKVKEEETIQAGKYTNHPKYQEYRSETNLHVKRAMEKRKRSEEQQEEENQQHNEDEDTSNFVL